MRKLLVGLVVLVLAAVAAVVGTDGCVRRQVERDVAANLQVSVPFTSAPTVQIDGWPFVWHAATRRFSAAHVRAEGMPMKVADREVTLRAIDLTLTDVAYAPDAVTAGRLTGTAELTYADLSTLAGLPVTFSAPDRLEVATRVELLGVGVDAVVSGKPLLDAAAQTITVTEPQVSVAGVSVAPAIVQAILDRTVKPVGVPLQYDLRMTSAKATPTGVALAVEGAGVRFPTR